MKGFWVTAAAAVALCCSRPANAEWLVVRLKPNNLAASDRIFTVKAETEAALRHFTITMKPKKGSVPDRSRADLLVVVEDRKIAVTQVDSSRDRAGVTYRFSLAPSAVASSRLEISEAGALGGEMWTMELRDFDGGVK